MHSLQINVLPLRLAVCRLDQNAAIPTWAMTGEFFTISRAPGELSMVCEEERVPPGVRMEAGWRGLQVAGPLDFALTGILAGLAGTLAEAGISLFAISTFDTDYILVKEQSLDRAIEALRQAGHTVDR